MDKIEASFTGLVVGDALCMPVHWYYTKDKLQRDYGEVSEMMAPKKIHPESMVSKKKYTGHIDILHDKSQFFEGHTIEQQENLSEEEIKALSEGNGNFLGKKEDERLHYHATLKKGQNTVSVCTTRLLGRYLAEACKNGSDGYCPSEFLEKWKDYMTTNPQKFPNDAAQIKAHNDLYLDWYLLHFYSHASNGVPLMKCAHNERDFWAVNALDGVVMTVPLILAYIKDPEAMLVGRAVEHHMLTHRAVTITMGVVVVAPLLQKLVNGEDFNKVLDEAMDKLRPPKLTGKQMADSYANTRGGPEYIPKPEKWAQHMEASDESLRALIRSFIANDVDENEVAGWFQGNGRFGTVCYVEHSLPVVLYLACKYQDDFAAALSANARLGGHSTARGALLGAILGAGFGSKVIPESWVKGLADPEQIKQEAKALASLTQ